MTLPRIIICCENDGIHVDIDARIHPDSEDKGNQNFRR